MNQPRTSELNKVLEAYWVVLSAVQRAAVPGWVELEMTMSQLKLFFTISLAGHITVGKVAETLGIGLPTASHLIERLARAGLVERTEQESDRRYTLVSLSVKGGELLAHLRQGRSNLVLRWLEQLGTEELAALEVGLTALARIALIEQAVVAAATEIE